MQKGGRGGVTVNWYRPGTSLTEQTGSIPDMPRGSYARFCMTPECPRGTLASMRRASPAIEKRFHDGHKLRGLLQRRDVAALVEAH
jgi:hypothetical protein